MSNEQPTSGKPTERLIQASDFGGIRLKGKFRYRKPVGESLGEMFESLGAFVSRPRVKRAMAALLVVAALGGGVWAYFALRTPPVPNYAEDDLEDVLDYTLLTDEFNRLSIDDRLALIKELVSRMKGMDGSDSALLAAFAAGISGKAREQLMKNADKLAIDVWDKYAKAYEKVPPGDVDSYLDQAFIDFTETMEDIAGVNRNISPSKRLGEAKSQAKRDAERMRETAGEPARADRVAGFFGMMNKRGANETTPAQRGRMTKFAQDMTRHLRNQDVNTGKPKTPGEPADAPKPPTPEVPGQPPQP